MTESILMLVAVVAIASFLDLRAGMYLLLLVGFAQDPLRKLLPDAPVYVSALVVLVAASTFVGAAQSGAIRAIAAIPGWTSRLQVPILLFIAMVLAQSVATFFYTGSPVLTGIGMLVYLAPFPALLLGYRFASNPRRVEAFFWVYVVLSAAAASGIYLSWLGMDWEILQSVGTPLVVYSLETGEALELPSGFLRTPEVAAWHAASGACIVLILGFVKRRMDSGLLSVALALFFAGAVILTGRRKFLIEVFVFLPIVCFLLWRFKIAAGRVLYLLFAVGIAGVLAMVAGIADSDTRNAFEAPVMRSENRISEIYERIENLTIGSIPYILEDNGFFGSGAGSGSGGSQYYGGGEDRVGLAAEGGFGKVLAEIGVPGILIFLWLGFRFVTQAWRMLGTAATGAPEGGRLAIGVTAFIAANGLVFAGAHQVYSDPFILLIVGLCIGFILAAHHYARLSEVKRVPGERSLHTETRFWPVR